MKILNSTIVGRGPWVVEFSQSQRRFSVQPLGDAVRLNLSRFVKAEGSDYMPIRIFPTREDATVFIDACNLRRDRDKPFSREELLAAEAEWRASRAVLGEFPNPRPIALIE